MDDQQRLQEMLSQLEVYRSQSDVYQQQIDAIQASLNEINIFQSTLDDLNGKDSMETLVPIGAGSFINAEIKNENKVLMSLGAGVAVNKTYEEAKELAERQKKELEDTLDKLFKDYQRLTDIIGQIAPQAEQLMQRLQAQGFAPK